MREKEEVEVKFDELRKRRLSQMKQQFLSRYYRNCKYNKRMTVKGQGKCGFCVNVQVCGSGKKPFVCDEEGTAKKCKFFEYSNSPESVEKKFKEILRSPSKCGEVYPKLAIMIWFLQSSDRGTRIKRLGNSVKDICRSVFHLLLGRWW